MNFQYAKLLSFTYADRETTLEGDDEAFRFAILNPAVAGGEIVIARQNGAFCLHFFGLHRDFGTDFGATVALADRLIAGETVVFQCEKDGACVLRGTRRTAELDIDSTLAGFVRSLCGHSPVLHARMSAWRREGHLLCRVRGWSGEDNRTFLLS